MCVCVCVLGYGVCCVNQWTTLSGAVSSPTVASLTTSMTKQCPSKGYIY